MCRVTPSWSSRAASRQRDRPTGRTQAVTGTNHQAQFMLLTAETVTTGHLATVASCSGGAGTWPADAGRHGQYSVCAPLFLSHACSSPHCRLMGLHCSERWSRSALRLRNTRHRLLGRRRLLVWTVGVALAIGLGCDFPASERAASRRISFMSSTTGTRPRVRIRARRLAWSGRRGWW